MIMESMETEKKEMLTGMLYLPEGHQIDYPHGSGNLIYKEMLYDPEKVDDDTLNYKFLLPAIEAAKDQAVDFIVGFSADQNRIILGYKNLDEKFQAFTAHQQASLFTEFFLNQNAGEDGGKLVVKSLLLSNQIDNIVKKNEGTIHYTYSGFDALVEEATSGDFQHAIGFDDRNTVVVNPDVKANASEVMDLLSTMVLQLHAQELSLFDKHVNIQIRYNLFGEKTFNIASGSKKMFDKFRTDPPADLIHEELISITDYKKRTFSNLLTGRKGSTDFEQMNLVQLDYSSGLRISVEFVEDQNRIVLHLSNFTHCYDKTRFAESRKAVHDRLLKVVVSLGKF